MKLDCKLVIKIVFLGLFHFGVFSFSQVGINTQAPLGVFHVDAAKDNPLSGTPSSTQQSNDFIITSEGKVGVGIIDPSSKFEVDGSSTNKSSYNAGSSTVIDFSKSNLSYTTASAGAFTLNNIKDGGTYTLSVRGTSSGISSFTSPGFSFRIINNNSTVANTHTLYTFLVMGTVVYVYCVRGV